VRRFFTDWMLFSDARPGRFSGGGRYPRMELAVSEPDHIVSWATRGLVSLPVNVA
jgi:hypothetical protein